MRYFTELYFVKQLFGEGLIFNIMKYAPLVILLLSLLGFVIYMLEDTKLKKYLDKTYMKFKRKKGE